MKRKNKLLKILLALLIALNQLAFFVPLNADETESEPEITTESESFI